MPRSPFFARVRPLSCQRAATGLYVASGNVQTLVLREFYARNSFCCVSSHPASNNRFKIRLHPFNLRHHIGNDPAMPSR